MELFRDVVLVVVPLVLCIGIHEYAHARAAWWLGDDTAARQGRLTLNPLAHADPIGTIGLPILMVLSGSGFLFGWGKPVPVAPVLFRRQFSGKRISMAAGHALVSAAGPLSNIVMGFLSAVILKIMLVAGVHEPAVLKLFQTLVGLNYLLAVFNMIPIPPLDGHSVWGWVLPGGAGRALRKLQENQFLGWVLLIALIGTGLLSRIVGPVISGLWTATSFLLGL
jgi:Zn-dependent protease